jgi:hypothetical protein
MLLPVPAAVPLAPPAPLPVSPQKGSDGCGFTQPDGPPEPTLVQAAAPTTGAALTQSSSAKRWRSSWRSRTGTNMAQLTV